jgi:hypothetical protein
MVLEDFERDCTGAEERINCSISDFISREKQAQGAHCCLWNWRGLLNTPGII